MNRFLRNIFIVESWYTSNLKIGNLEYLACSESAQVD